MCLVGPAQQNDVRAIVFSQPNIDFFFAGSRNIFADIIGAYGQFAVPPINQDGQLHFARAAMIEQGIQRGASGAPGIKDIIDEDYHPVCDVYGDFGWPDVKLRAA